MITYVYWCIILILSITIPDELCAPEVITTELIDGVPLDKLFDADYETRVDIAYKIMQLCLREMFVLRCMQTDPNWANFFYNPNTKQVIVYNGRNPKALTNSYTGFPARLFGCDQDCFNTKNLFNDFLKRLYRLSC